MVLGPTGLTGHSVQSHVVQGFNPDIVIVLSSHVVATAMDQTLKLNPAILTVVH